MVQALGLLLNIILLGSGWWGAYSVFGSKEVGARLLASSLLAWAWCILGMQILGILGFLNPPGLACWVGLGLLVALGTRYRLGEAEQDGPVAALTKTQVLAWPALLCLTALIWVCLEMASQSLFFPVKVMSDGPIYHLYFATRWWKAGKYFLVAAPFGENAATYFPANGDLWFAWLIATWGGDRFARVGQAPFLVLSGIASYQISRLLGAGRSSSLIATTWFLTSTAFLVFSFQANVDTIFIANYLVATYFFLRYARGNDGITSLFLGGLAAGGALGTKSVAIVFVPPLILFALTAALKRPGSTNQRVTRTVGLILSTLILSGFWYIQNALLTGNPVYPLRVELFGRTLLTGWYGPDAMQQSQFYIPLSFWRAFGDIMLAVLDPRLAPFWIVAVAGAWAVPRPPKPAQTRWIWLISLLSVANVLLYWLFVPYRTQQRFMLQALGLAVAPLAQTFDRSRWLGILGSFLLIVHIATPQSWPIAALDDRAIPWDLTHLIPNAISPPLSLVSTVSRTLASGGDLASSLYLALYVTTGVLAGIVAWSWTRPAKKAGLARHTLPIASLSALLLLGFFAYGPGTAATPRQLFYPPFRDFYVGWMNFDNLAGPNGARVAYAGTNIPYYLFGTGLRNDVRYINIDKHRDWLLHDYHHLAESEGNGVWPNSRPGWDRLRPDYLAWLANLEAERIQLLVVTRVNTSEGAHNVADSAGFPIEKQWADSHPDRFQMVYGEGERDPWFRVYRLLQP